MGSLQELQKLLRQKDVTIRDLQHQVKEKDEKIQTLTSQLDKFQTIVDMQNPVKVGPRKVRAQGISAEPQSQRTLLDIKSHKKCSKPTR